MQRNAAFIRAGIAREEPVLVMVRGDKIDALHDELDREAAPVEFVDMAEAGRNPGRIISRWSDFAAENAGGPMRGIGEPIWDGRGREELLECHHHESLVNLAFGGVAGLRLACSYDTEALPATVIEEARRTHPLIADGDELRESREYMPSRAHEHHHARLPRPDARTNETVFDVGSLALLRRFVRDQAEVAHLPVARADDLVMAVNEAATNSIRYGGGTGRLRTWINDVALVCEVRDRGVIDDPTLGRVRPSGSIAGGHGLWLAHQVCDLVQVRSDKDGSVVRMHVLLPAL